METVMRPIIILMLVVVMSACGQPQQAAKSETNAGTIADFAKVGAYEQFKSRGFYIVHLPEGKLVALDTASTHLGCITNWLADKQMFKNPCNGSLYDLNGINRTGVDPRPLERYRIYVHDGQVVVDKTVRFRSERDEWDSSRSFIKLSGT
jgi:Rieske Fe-S protein